MAWMISASAPQPELTHEPSPIRLGRWRAVLTFRPRASSDPDRPFRLSLQVRSPSGEERADPQLVLVGTDQGVRCTLELMATADQLRLTGQIAAQTGPTAASLLIETLELTWGEVELGPSRDLSPGGSPHVAGERYAFYKNGYQSWSASRAFAPHERERVPRLTLLNVMQDNVRNLPTGRTGEFTSDLFGLLGNLTGSCYLFAGAVGGWAQGLYVRVCFNPRTGRPWTFSLIWDCWGQQLDPEGVIPLDPVVLLAGVEPCALQEEWLARILPAAPSPAQIRLQSDPPLFGSEPGRTPATGNSSTFARLVNVRPVTGWCSWYDHGRQVTQDHLTENLAVARRRSPGWHLFQLDDGYQTAVGDWLSLRHTFSRGLGQVAQEIRDAGLQPGLWFAPFLATRRSRLFREHRSWFLQDERGQPVSAGFNPLWGWEGGCLALDTTHPGFQEYLHRVIRSFVREWGFALLKLDFLYAGALPGRAHDPTLSGPQRLALGYRLIREAAGADVFLLGCGAPLGPSIGQVHGMRVGPDVAPFWFPTWRYHLTRDPHALSACFAIRNVLHRSPLHGCLWLNDPDCLLLREQQSRLTEAERIALTTAVVVAGGLLLVSDRLSRLSEAAWQRLNQAQEIARRCAQGRIRALDFMERPMAQLVYNSSGYLGIFHFGDRPRESSVELRLLQGVLRSGSRPRSVWDDRTIRIRDGQLELGMMEPHAAVLLEL